MAVRYTIVFLLAAAPAARAQQSVVASVELRMDARTLEVGEAVDVQLVCTNTGAPDTPKGAVPEGLDLQLLNPTPAQQSSISIINGRRSQQSTYTYHLRLVALDEGTYTLGPFSVEADGASYATGTVAIAVVRPAADDTPRGDREMFVELELEPEKLYVTETYAATLSIGIRKVELNGRVYDLDLLELIDRTSQLSIFARERYSVGRRVLPDAAGRRHEYVVYQVRKTVRAEQVGEQRVGPVFLKLNYPTDLRKGFWGNLEVSRSRKVSARAEAVTVKVKGPPDEGRPASYSGAIGQYDLRVSALPLRVEQNQPITLTIAISGAPVSGVAGPNLAQNAELVSRFDFSKEELLGEIEGNAKVFRRAIFPKQPGVQTIPPISWAYFDPRRERYLSLSSDPIDITVEEPSAPAAAISLVDARGRPADTQLTLLAGGISPNYVDPAELLGSHTFALTPLWIGTLVAPPLLFVVVLFLTRYLQRLATDAGFARRRRARRRAHAHLARARRNGEPAARLEGFADALTAYVSDRFNLPPGPVTPAEVRELLAHKCADDALAGEVARFLDDCEAARYAPGTAARMPRGHAAEKVCDWLKRIERSTQ